MGLARHCYAIFITPPRAFRQRGPGPSGALSGAGMYPASAAIFMLRACRMCADRAPNQRRALEGTVLQAL